MEAFYARWNAKGESTRISAAAALRKAQEDVASRERWKHPAYWAAWQLWGLGD